jgi:branched-chain amino acid transport system permease protein
MDFAVFFQLFLPGLTTGCVYALVALGFVLTANVSGVVNFAQGEFVMLGGVVAAARCCRQS